MKKLLQVAMVIGVMALLFSSCTSTKSCPAYGDVEHQVEEVNS